MKIEIEKDLSKPFPISSYIRGKTLNNLRRVVSIRIERVSAGNTLVILDAFSMNKNLIYSCLKNISSIYSRD